jgi:ABC-type antimicrobial peptide transport system permease subunit
MSYLPLDFLHAEMRFSIPGKAEFANPALRSTADFESVTPDYFETFGVRIVRGRAFSDADNASSRRVAIVNEAFVSRFLQGIDPLQQRVAMGQLTSSTINGPTVDWQIIGVFHTVKSRGSRDDNPEIDTPFWQEAFPISAIAVRTKENPGTMVKSIAAAVNSVDSKAALALTRTMEQVHDDELANDRFTLVLFAGFGVLGLLLATLGIYGMTAFSVTQRKREIAVRMALGASRNRVLALVVKEGVMLACAGLGFGLIVFYFVGRAVESVLFGVRAVDFSTIAAVGASLLLGAVSACYLPARRATGIDPAQALRHE